MTLGWIILFNPSLWWSVYSAALWAAMPQILTAAAMIGGSIALNYAMRSKPSRGGSTALDRTAFPTIAEGQSYPIIFGTVRIDGYDAEWVGNTYVYERERNDVIVYRYYYAGTHFIYCRGPVDGLKQLWYGEAGGGKCAWPTVNNPAVYAADGLTTITVAATLYGGVYEGGQGPITGIFDILLGTTTQAQNAYLVSQLGANIPAFRGVASLVGRQAIWGCLSIPLVLGGVWKRIAIQDDGTARWYIAKAAINTLDINPVHVMRECLLNTDWGESMDSTDLGTSWTTVADTLYTEGFGISYWLVPEPGNLKQFLAAILEVIDGIMYHDIVTGKLEIALVRLDYEVGDLAAFDEADFEILNFIRPHWRDVPGRIVIKYSDRQRPDAGVQADYTDSTIINRQGRVVEQVFDYPMLCNGDLAATVAARKGRAIMARAAMISIRCKRNMSALHIGSVFKISYDDPYLAITSMVVRVVSITDGGSGDETLEMTVVEDVYAQEYTVIANPPDTEWGEPSTSVVVESASPSASPSSSASAS